MTVKQKDRNELLASFERHRLEYENKKKREIEEIQEEITEKEAVWEMNAKNWKGEMKKMTDQLKVSTEDLNRAENYLSILIKIGNWNLIKLLQGRVAIRYNNRCFIRYNALSSSIFFS